MAFDPENYCDLAYELFRNPAAAEQAYFRSAISRAYYGAFLRARDKAGITTKGANVHEETANYYLVRNCAAISNRLNELRVLRNKADYDISESFDRRKVQGALSRAVSIFKELADPSDPAASQ